MSRFTRWWHSIVLGCVSVAGLQAQPSVSITAPSTIGTGATYPISVTATDASGHLITLTVNRNGVYWASASSVVGQPSRFNLTVSGNDTAPTTPGTISLFASVTTDSSPASTSASITVFDGTLPSVPTGLSATSLTTTSFILNWTASTDNVAVTGYEVMRDTTSLGPVAGTSLAVTGLTPGVIYAMTVRARDAAANWSAWSAALNVTTPKASQAAVTITSASTATYGNVYTATATGGTGTGALSWSLGTGSTANGAAIDVTTGVITAKSTGTVVINVFRAADTNYNASATTANFTITVGSRPVTVTLAGTKVYNGNTASTGASATITTGSAGGTDTVGFAFAATSSAVVGTYTSLTTATFSNTVTPTARSANYAITYAGSYTITKATPVAPSVTSAATGTYGNAYTATGTGSSGTGALAWALGTGSTASGATINSSTGVITVNSSGTVVIKVQRLGDTNYNASPFSADFTVTFAARPLTVTLSGTKVYNATTASTGATATITTGTLAGTDTIGFAFAATSSANAGSYTGLTTATVSNTVTPTNRTSSYAITYAGSYVISKASQAAVTISSPATGTYGTAYTGTATGGTGTGALSWSLGTGSTADTPAINATSGAITARSFGTVVIKVFRAADTNYNVSATTADFTVTLGKRALSITLAGTRAYNGTTASTGASASITAGSLASGDTIGYAYGSTSSDVVGSYTSLATATISNTTAPTNRSVSYTVTYAGSYTITKANQPAMTVSSGTSATYGTLYTATATGGAGTGAPVWALGTGSTATGAAINASTGDITANSSGTVVIKVFRAADTNYNVSATTANFTVTVAKRPITVSFGGAKTYDGLNAPTGALAEITNGTLAVSDTIGYAFANTVSANAGAYTGITTATISNTSAPTTRTASYVVTFVGNYTINPVAATFSLSSTSYSFSGAPQGPSVAASPVGATFTTAGTLSATAIGNYSATVTGTGNYAGGGPLPWEIIADTIAPSIPGNLTVSQVSSSSFVLNWDAATDNAAMGSYTVYMDGFPVANTSGTSYTLSSLDPATSYVMSVQAQDYSNNLSALSLGVSVRTLVDSSAVPELGLRLWLRADMALTLDGSGRVQSWPDQARGNDATQAVDSARPLFVVGAANGQPVIRFDGTDDYLDVPTFMADTQQGELFVVMKVPNFNSRDDGLWTLGGSDGTETEIIGTRHLTEDFGRSYRIDIGAPVVPLTNYVVYTVSAVEGDWTVRLNGIEQFRTTTNPLPTFGTNGSLGRAVGKYFQGDIAEVIAFDRFMDGTEQSNIATYLKNKYGVTVMALPVIDSPLSVNCTATNPLSPTYLITASDSPTSFSATGLPAGLSINTATGVIAGTPSVVGTFNATIGATNAAGTGTAILVFVVSAPPPPVINSALTRSDVVSTAFAYTITATNAPTSYAATPLPAGLSLNSSTGVISGTPTTTGTTNVTIGATNLGGTGSATLVITINPSLAPVITSALTRVATVNVALSPNYSITASNTPTSFSATGLPAGLSLNSTTGVISGTPTAIAVNNVTIKATNANGTGVAILTLTVNPPVPVISSLLTRSAPINTPLSPPYAIAASNSPTSFNATNLPDGLAVNPATGVISGTPTTLGVTSVTISATNLGGTDTKTLVFTIAPIATTFALNATAFYYTGSVQGPTVVPSPSGATFSAGGTISATAIGNYTTTASGTGNYGGTNNSLTWSIVADSVAPGAPTSVVASNVTSSGLSLTWTAGTDNIGVVGYNIYKDGLALGVSSSTTFATAGLTSATSYTITVKSRDAAGNLSSPSTAIVVTTLNPSAALPTTGMRLWLRADAGTTLDGNGAVSAWSDQSPALNHVSQSQAIARPLYVANGLNGLPVLRFEAGSDQLELPDLMGGGSSGEIFIIARLKDTTHPKNGLMHFGGSSGTIYNATQLWNDFGTGDGTPGNVPAGDILLQPHLFDTSMASDGTSVLRFNNTEFLRRTGLFVTFRSNPLLGADWQGEHFNGDIAEVIVYNRVLTDVERGGVTAYLTSKYGLVGPLENPTGDADGDGLSNADEVNLFHSNPYAKDTDNDGFADGDEVFLGLNPLVNDAGADLDGDGIPNSEDARPGNPAIGRMTITILSPLNGS